MTDGTGPAGPLDAGPVGSLDAGEGGLLGFVAPGYGVASLADVLPGVLAALGVAGESDPLGLAVGPLAGVRRVVVLLVDGLGYHLLGAAAEHGAVLAGAVAGRYGWLRAATSGFPSTTPTSLVTLATGAPPGAHGVVGFTVAVPGTDRILTHIRWRGDDADVSPRAWQPVPTAFERAAAAGVAAVVVNRGEFAGSGLTVATYRGADYRPADGVDQTVAGVLAAVRGADRALVYAYHGRVDHAAHAYGLASPRWGEAVAEADRLIAGIAAGLPPDAALLVTADHGGLDVPPADPGVPSGATAPSGPTGGGGGERFDIDGRAELTGPGSGVRVVAGEPRVRHVYARPGAAADVLAAWREGLAGRALVVGRAEAIGAGWFGPAVTAAAAARIGDVVAVCTGRNVLVATVREASSAGLVGYHGSLTAVEMAVPLLVVRSGEVVTPGGVAPGGVAPGGVGPGSVGPGSVVPGG
jgi:hypothetical protein